MARRRSSTVIDEYVLNTNLNRAEQTELHGHYKKTPQTNGGITFYDYINILKSNPTAMKTLSSSPRRRGASFSNR